MMIASITLVVATDTTMKIIPNLILASYVTYFDLLYRKVFSHITNSKNQSAILYKNALNMFNNDEIKWGISSLQKPHIYDPLRKATSYIVFNGIM